MIHMIHACFGSIAQVNIVDAPDTLPHMCPKNNGTSRLIVHVDYS